MQHACALAVGLGGVRGRGRVRALDLGLGVQKCDQLLRVGWEWEERGAE
jgi:hypothetical protein